MKKIISFLLIIIMLLSLVGCNNQETPKESASETEKETDSKIYNAPYEDITFYNDWGYNQFEYFLPANTDIVRAKYVGTVKKAYSYLHDFEVKEVYKGICEKGAITVLASPAEYNFVPFDGVKPPLSSYSTINIEYEVGKDYLLLLARSQNVYMEKDRLESIEDSLVIPLHKDGSIDFKNCQLYNTYLIFHLRDKETEEALKNGTFIERLLELTKDNPTYNRKIDTTYKDPETTMNEADYVWSIEIEAKIEDFMLPYYSSKYRCKIVDKLKGDYRWDTETLQLPTEKVEVGKTYVVALDSDRFLSSRYSLFEYSVDYSTKKTDMITLCNEAAYVYVVEVEEKQFVGRDCKILSSLKGEYENEEIYLFVHEDDFEVGKKYVVALDKDKKLICMTEIPPTTQ